MNFVSLFRTNIVEDRLAILFNSLIVDILYRFLASIFWHQYDMVGYLTITMAKAVQFQRVSHPGQKWLAPPLTMCQKQTHFTKKR